MFWVLFTGCCFDCELCFWFDLVGCGLGFVLRVVAFCVLSLGFGWLLLPILGVACCLLLCVGDLT